MINLKKFTKKIQILIIFKKFLKLNKNNHNNKIHFNQAKIKITKPQIQINNQIKYLIVKTIN